MASPWNLRASDPLYLDATQPVETRVEDLLSRLTLDEKISIIHADSKFTTAAIPRLGIPRRWLSDGPHGVREDVGPDTWQPAGHTDDFSTAMPAGICLAATWNPELGFSEGEVIGQEARKRGKDIMLGPGVKHPAGRRSAVVTLNISAKIPGSRRAWPSVTSAAHNRRTFHPA